MKIKLVLMTAGAIGALSSATALADGNSAYLDQAGDSNSALITQGGTGNKAGSNAGVSTASPPDNPNPLLKPDGRILQFGHHQSLTINQVGNNNEAGASTVNPWLGINQGHSAASTNNTLTIDQLTSSNIVGRVRQTGSGNTATVTQKGSDTNFIANLYQEHGNTATITQDGEKNWLGQFGNDRVQANGGAIYQAVHYEASGKPSTLIFTQKGNYNLTTGVAQRGGFEAATIDIVGNYNTLKKVDQSSGYGSDNAIGYNILDIDITGNNNGSGAGSLAGAHGYLTYGTFSTGSAAEGVLGAVTAYISDQAALAGASSFVVPAVPDGTSGFMSSVHQFGASNDLSFIVAGSYNQFGMLQGGDFNYLSGTVGGSSNQIALVQFGDYNEVTFVQDGDSNDAGIAIRGNGNFLNLDQNNTGVAGNRALVTITGNGNNRTSAPSFSGAALAASSSLEAGDLFQTGSGNSLTLTVASSNNAFATSQTGTGNSIVGVIQGGNANQAIVTQNGNNNVSNFSQNGAANNVGITQ